MTVTTSNVSFSGIVATNNLTCLKAIATRSTAASPAVGHPVIAARIHSITQRNGMECMSKDLGI